MVNILEFVVHHMPWRRKNVQIYLCFFSLAVLIFLLKVLLLPLLEATCLKHYSKIDGDIISQTSEHCPWFCGLLKMLAWPRVTSSRHGRVIGARHLLPTPPKGTEGRHSKTFFFFSPIVKFFTSSPQIKIPFLKPLPFSPIMASWGQILNLLKLPTIICSKKL